MSSKNSKAFKRRAFAWLNNQIKAGVKAGKYPPSAFMICYELATKHFNEEHGGEAWPSLKTLAGAIGKKSETTANNLVRLLVAAGDLRVQWGSKGSGRSHRYWMVEKKLQPTGVSEDQKTPIPEAKKLQSSAKKLQSTGVNLNYNHDGGTNVPPYEGVENAHSRVSNSPVAGAPEGAREGGEGSKQGDSRGSEVIPLGPVADLKVAWVKLTSIYERGFRKDHREDFVTRCRNLFFEACRRGADHRDIVAGAIVHVEAADAPRYLSPLDVWLETEAWRYEPPPPKRKRGQSHAVSIDIDDQLAAMVGAMS